MWRTWGPGIILMVFACLHVIVHVLGTGCDARQWSFWSSREIRKPTCITLTPQLSHRRFELTREQSVQVPDLPAFWKVGMSVNSGGWHFTERQQREDYIEFETAWSSESQAWASFKFKARRDLPSPTSPSPSTVTSLALRLRAGRLFLIEHDKKSPWDRVDATITSRSLQPTHPHPFQSLEKTPKGFSALTLPLDAN